MNKMPVVFISGASSGIGFELACCFAVNHYDLAITGRNQEKLSELALRCEKDYGIKVYTLCADLSEADAAKKAYHWLEKNHLSVEILINNAGFGVFGDFYKTPISSELALVQVHINFILAFTKLVLNDMLAQQRGKILNVGSLYSYTPVPQQSVYAASKAFLASFSLALHEELREKNISVSLLCPGATLTSFRHRAGVSEKKFILAMTSAEVAKIAYQELMKNKAVIVPGFFNKIFYRLSNFLPARAIHWLIYSSRGIKIK